MPMLACKDDYILSVPFPYEYDPVKCQTFLRNRMEALKEKYPTIDMQELILSFHKAFKLDKWVQQEEENIEAAEPITQMPALLLSYGKVFKGRPRVNKVKEGSYVRVVYFSADDKVYPIGVTDACVEYCHGQLEGWIDSGKLDEVAEGGKWNGIIWCYWEDLQAQIAH